MYHSSFWVSEKLFANRIPVCTNGTGFGVTPGSMNYHMATKYGKKAQDKVEKTMHELKHGELKSGSGQKVTSRKQAIAIGLSEARKEGGKVPSAKSTPSHKPGPKKGR
jgi:hypothetical protein